VVPDAGGNRAFCRPQLNCLQPAAEADALADAVGTLRDDPARAAAGPGAAAPFSLQAERQAVHRLLDQLPQLWSAASSSR
jgi:hypothetical protein